MLLYLLLSFPQEFSVLHHVNLQEQFVGQLGFDYYVENFVSIYVIHVLVIAF